MKVAIKPNSSISKELRSFYISGYDFINFEYYYLIDKVDSKDAHIDLDSASQYENRRAGKEYKIIDFNEWKLLTGKSSINEFSIF